MGQLPAVDGDQRDRRGDDQQFDHRFDDHGEDGRYFLQRAAGALLTGANGTISISPNSAGVTSVGIGAGITPSAGRLSIDSGLLAASTAQTFTISGGANGSISVGVGGAVDLSAISSPYNLVLQAPGGLDFQNTLTLASGLTFTLTSPGGVTDSTGAGVPAIVISGGTLDITGTTADIGAAGHRSDAGGEFGRCHRDRPFIFEEYRSVGGEW